MVDLFLFKNRIRNATNNIRIDIRTTEKLIIIGIVHLFKIVDWINDIWLVISIFLFVIVVWLISKLSWIRRFSHINIRREKIFVWLRFKLNQRYLSIDGQIFDCVLIINVGVRKIAARVLIFNGSLIWKYWHVILRKINCVSSGIKLLKDKIGWKQSDNCKSNFKEPLKEKINFVWIYLKYLPKWLIIVINWLNVSVRPCLNDHWDKFFG